MGKLHELLAVEADKEGKYKRIVAETKKDFKDKQSLFIGSVRTLQMFDENDTTEYPEEHQEMATTVPKRLAYTEPAVIEYFDALLQKEATNQVAKADIVIDGATIAEGVPATFLLGLESRLTKLREMYEAIPTLTVGIKWEKDPSRGDDVYVMANPEEKLKTARHFKHQVLEPARFPNTDKGEGGQALPAQIEKWEEVMNVGKFTKHVWTGMLSSADKAVLLERMDKLIQAVKKARQTANRVTVEKVNIGGKLLNYINNG